MAQHCRYLSSDLSTKDISMLSESGSSLTKFHIIDKYMERKNSSNELLFICAAEDTA